MRSVLAICGVFGLLALGAWHFHPVLAWHLDVGPRLEGHPNAAAMKVETFRSVSKPPADWTRLEVENLTLHVPILAEQLENCATCTGECRLEIQDGVMTVYEPRVPETYEEALDTSAPDPSEITVTRPAWRNWATLEALTQIVENENRPMRSLRFDTPSSRGVVLILPAGDYQRYIIYAYSPEGEPARVVRITTSRVADVMRVLESLEVSSGDGIGADGAPLSRCTPSAPSAGAPDPAPPGSGS
jgi:hypothetical protein